MREDLGDGFKSYFDEEDLSYWLEEDDWVNRKIRNETLRKERNIRRGVYQA